MIFYKEENIMEQEVKLERKLNPLNVWALALGSIIGWGAFVMPGTTFLPKAGVLGTLIGIIIAIFIMSTIALNCGYMVQKYPVAGGGYAFTKYTYGTKHAYLCGWFLALSYLAIVPLNATALALVSRKLLGGTLQVGYIYTIANYDIYLGEVALASLALILFAFLSIKGISVAGWLQTVLALGLVASVFILGIAALIHPDVKLSNLQPAYPRDSTAFSAIAAVIAVSPWAFVGFDSIPQAAEEFSFSPKKANILMILSIVFGGSVYVILNTITASIMPWEELLSYGYDWPTGEAVEFIMGKVGLLFLGIALVCAVLSGIIGFYMTTSRLLFSMAREQALPTWFGKIDEKTKTPKNAILFVMVISLFAPWFGREVLGWIVDMSSIGAAIGYFYTCLATYRTLKDNPQDKKPGLMVCAILGAVFSLCFVALLIIPGMPTYLVPQARICLLVWILLGVIFYFWSKRSLKN